MSETLLKGGRVIGDPGGDADVRIANGVIVEVGRDLAAASDEEVLDCSGCWVGPGFVDLHTHLREPGEEWKEDIESGSRAAAAGGFTAIVAMPNTEPPIDAGHLARYVADRGQRVGLVEVVPAGCLSAGRAGSRLAHIDELWAAGVRLFTDDGDALMDAGLARRAMEYLAELGGVFAQHAEDAGLVSGGHMHEGEVSSRLGMPARPAAAEEIMLNRDLALVRLTGVRYHALHLSTAGAVAALAAAKAAGLPVTGEVTPHHLTFTDADVAATDPVFKMNPPLRTAADVAALRSGLLDGVIDAVATDHAPHAAHEKDVPFQDAPPGVIGLETAAAAVHSALDPGAALLFGRLAIAPARIAGLERQGGPVAPGRPANLTVFDPAQEWVVEAGYSRSANTPFTGRRLRGRSRYTIYDGRVTWSDGKVQA